jgi:hypothetical protein
MKKHDPYATVEEVWQWRKNAYGELSDLPEEERVRRINAIGRKYSTKLHLRRVDRELVKK